MAALSDYLSQVRLLIHDANAYYFSDAQVISYINQSRQRVSSASGCLRTLYPMALPQGQEIYPMNGAISALTLSAGGSGYVNPTVTINDTSGTGAAASATVSGGVVTGLTVTAPGQNYVAPTVSISDSSGTGAAATASFTQGIVDVLGVSYLWGNIRVSLGFSPWSRFNTLWRAWKGFQTNPSKFSTFGTTVYVAPVPPQLYQSDWDCAVVASNLASTSDIDPIPYPYTEPVQYYAAYLAYLGMQKPDYAEQMLALYQRFLLTAAADSARRRIVDPYADWDQEE